MATQSWIIGEELIVTEEALKCVERISRAVDLEIKSNEGYSNTRPHVSRENSDCWGTLAINLRYLAACAEQLAKKIDEAR